MQACIDKVATVSSSSMDARRLSVVEGVLGFKKNEIKENIVGPNEVIYDFYLRTGVE